MFFDDSCDYQIDFALHFKRMETIYRKAEVRIKQILDVFINSEEIDLLSSVREICASSFLAVNDFVID